MVGTAMVCATGRHPGPLQGWPPFGLTSVAFFSGGQFHTGGLAVCHPDGYIETKDCAKEIVISGGENISSLEIKGILHQHPAVLLAAVVLVPDEKWGETPCAVIELKDSMTATPEELTAFCKARLAASRPRASSYSSLFRSPPRERFRSSSFVRNCG
jgi:acyl-CoA synthetase (AMP-forming)/AMP-acid ligase II